MSDTLFVLKREAAREPFRFEVDGEAFSVPHVKDVDQFALAELFSRAEKVTDLEFITGFLDLFLSDEDRPRLRALKLDRDSLLALYERIQKHNGVTAGESSASSA